jgi:very-short-patch-repair endonuclease
LLGFFENTKPQQIAGLDRVELERRAAQDNRGIVKPPPPFDSWFEVDVALEIVRKGFEVIPQFEMAGYCIDLVVEGGHARLAVECDGDNWHGVDHYEADMQRQRQLERCGWQFFRVRESVFYANKSGALKGLWQALDEREILPRFDTVGASPSEHLQETGPSNVVKAGRSIAKESGGEEVDGSMDDVPERLETSRRRQDDVTSAEIQHAIKQALSKRPNRSCTEKLLTYFVLKELGVRTSRQPRKEFEKRLMRNVGVLVGRGVVERYRSKNKRVRLLTPEDLLC